MPKLAYSLNLDGVDFDFYTYHWEIYDDGPSNFGCLARVRRNGADKHRIHAVGKKLRALFWDDRIDRWSDYANQQSCAGFFRCQFEMRHISEHEWGKDCIERNTDGSCLSLVAAFLSTRSWGDELRDEIVVELRDGLMFDDSGFQDGDWWADENLSRCGRFTGADEWWIE